MTTTPRAATPGVVLSNLTKTNHMLKPIPFTNKTLFFDTEQGFVLHYDGTELKINKDRTYNIAFINGSRAVTKGFLYLITHYPVHEEDRTVDYLFGWDIKYENKDDFTTAFWSVKESGPNWSEVDGVAIIPYYTAYGVTRTGILKTLYKSSQVRKGTVLKLQADKRGYSKLKLIQPCATKSPRLHRLVALAFLPVDANPIDNRFEMTVNHKDSNKANNAADNLEWINNAENYKHSVDESLRSKTETTRYEATVCCFMNDSESLMFDSELLACRYFDKPINYFSGVFHETGFDDGLGMWVALSSKFVSTVTFKNGKCVPIKDFRKDKSMTMQVVGFNIMTNTNSVWDAPNAVKKMLGININIYGYLLDHKSFPVSNWCFLWLDDMRKGKTFRTFTPEEVVVLKDKETIYYLYRATKDNQVTLATDVPELADKLSISKGYLYNLFKNASKISCHGYDIERLS